MTLIQRLFVPVALLVMVGCAAPSRVYHSPDAVGPPLEPSVVVMPADVVVSLFTAGGNPEPREDWSETVSRNLNVALENYLFERGVRFETWGELRDRDVDAVRRINVLLDAIEHRQFGGSIGGDRDYVLSEAERELLGQHDTDYALMIVLRSNRASGGRQAAAFLAAIGGVAMETSNAQFRSVLVNLRDGHLKSANFDPAALADIGDPLTAGDERWDRAVAHLLREFPL